MQFAEVLHRVQTGLAAPLPGAAAHAVMSPRPRRPWPDGLNPARIRNAAGLLLLFPADDTHLVLTVRADTLERHGGQVSLPGGVVDPGETFEQAALREAREEVALSPSEVRVLGALTPLDIPVSGFRLHPVLGAAAQRPNLVPADGEVAAILEVPIEQLLDSMCVVTTFRQRDGQRVSAPAFRIGAYDIWGATAMVIAEFLTLLGWRIRAPAGGSGPDPDF
jgi:8-oxo-dGTP pyrophosphatase MutT (NUDIX family)